MSEWWWLLLLLLLVFVLAPLGGAFGDWRRLAVPHRAATGSVRGAAFDRDVVAECVWIGILIAAFAIAIAVLS